MYIISYIYYYIIKMPNHKEKSKRKRGKKFIYDKTTSKSQLNPSFQSYESNQNKQISQPASNPFNSFESKKFMKTSQYNELRKEYQSQSHSSIFSDRRLGENSRNLSEDQKQMLRFKALQALNKKKDERNKFKYNLMENKNINASGYELTHKGVRITKDNVVKDNDGDAYENDDDYELDIANELMNKTEEGLTKKEQYMMLIDKAKAIKEEKKKEREMTKERIRQLDEDFAYINPLLNKRKKDIEPKNDGYYLNMNKFEYDNKTKPTERLKSKEEIEKEKKRKEEKMRKGDYSENDEDNEDDDRSNHNYDEDEDSDKGLNRRLTKKERIAKMIEKRILNAKNKANDNNNIKSSKNHEEDNDVEGDDGDDDDDDDNEEEYEEEGDDDEEEGDDDDEGEDDDE